VRALIVGAGAVGRYLGARLRLGGHDAVLYARTESARELLDDGVTLHVGAQEWPVAVGVASSPDDVSVRAPFELAIVAVKAYSTGEAIDVLRGLPSCAESTVLAVQNGIGNEEQLASAFGADRIAAAALTTAVAREHDAVVAADRGGLTFAPVGTPSHNWLLPLWSACGVEVRAANDWRALKWSKLCINLLANGVCAALDWTPAQVYADAEAFAIERECLVEATAVMQRAGIKPVGLVGFPVPVLVAAVRALSPSLLKYVLANRVLGARGDKLPSLLLDLRAGRRKTEAEAMYGAVARAAETLGMRAPANAAISRIVAGIAAGTIDWSLFRGNPAALKGAVDL